MNSCRFLTVAIFLCTLGCGGSNHSAQGNYQAQTSGHEGSQEVGTSTEAATEGTQSTAMSATEPQANPYSEEVCLATDKPSAAHYAICKFNWREPGLLESYYIHFFIDFTEVGLTKIGDATKITEGKVNLLVGTPQKSQSYSFQPGGTIGDNMISLPTLDQDFFLSGFNYGKKAQFRWDVRGNRFTMLDLQGFQGNCDLISSGSFKSCLKCNAAGRDCTRQSQVPEGYLESFPWPTNSLSEFLRVDGKVALVEQQDGALYCEGLGSKATDSRKYYMPSVRELAQLASNFGAEILDITDGSRCEAAGGKWIMEMVTRQRDNSFCYKYDKYRAPMGEMGRHTIWSKSANRFLGAYRLEMDTGRIFPHVYGGRHATVCFQSPGN